ncbi:unnamed protein product [Amoebophrya sp. A25]|nr:unnamed protein product [Amoebophrya sp. A25]|eukprot:GSA25T00021515001.1
MEQTVGHDRAVLVKYYALFEELAKSEGGKSVETLAEKTETGANSHLNDELRRIEASPFSPDKLGWFMRTHQSESYPMLLGLWPSQTPAGEADPSEGQAAKSDEATAAEFFDDEQQQSLLPPGSLQGAYLVEPVENAAGGGGPEDLLFTPVLQAQQQPFSANDLTPRAGLLSLSDASNLKTRVDFKLPVEDTDVAPFLRWNGSDKFVNEFTSQGFRQLSARMINELQHPHFFQQPLPNLFDVKIYIWEFHKFHEWTQRPLLCSQGMFATEVTFHRWLMYSPYRTTDPDEADFFFVPIYPSCIQTKFDKNIDDLNEFYISTLTTGDAKWYFERNDGRDFIFVFSSECLDFPKWKKYILRSIFISVEKTPIECTKDFGYVNEDNAEEYGKSCYHCNWCFSPWKDVLIPGFVEKWSIDKMMLKAKPYQERTNLVCYHGADSDEISLYKYANATARNDIQDRLAGIPGTSVGRRIPIIMDYFERMGTCVFCLVPKGLGYWSNRFFEIMFLGCIPVILSDDMGLPFPDRVPWKDFTIKWPMRSVDTRLVQYLEDLLMQHPDVVESMHRTLLDHLCWVSWHSQDYDCSPYRAIMEQLFAKKLGFPRHTGRFWNTELDSREYSNHMPYPYYRDQMEGNLPEPS